jgi:hypothetical protein
MMTEEEITKRRDELRKQITDTKEAWRIKEVRNLIVELIINHVEEHGSCRVGWAAQHIIGTEQQNHVHDKIMGLATRFGVYTKERNMLFQKDWNIFYNPNYELSEVTKTTSIIQRKALKITIGIGILTLIVTGVNIWLTLRYQKKQLDIQQRQQNLIPPSIKIDSVIVHQSKTDTTRG